MRDLVSPLLGRHVSHAQPVLKELHRLGLLGQRRLVIPGAVNLPTPSRLAY